MTRNFLRRNGALAGVVFASFSLALLACASGDTPKPATEVTAETQSSRPTVLPAVAAPVSVLSMRLSDAVGDDARKEVRVVDKPTLAALDFAAYYDNPIRLAGKDEKPENYKGLMANAKLAEYPFPMLDLLSESEPAVVSGHQPLAWEPFSKILYAQTGDDSLAKVLSAVEAVKWGEPDVFRAFQTVGRFWGIPMSDGTVEWWAEILPAIWTGRTVFFAKLKFVSRGETAEVLNHYITAEMNLDDAMNWARTLSSYWYPTLNTDLEPHTPGARWALTNDSPAVEAPFAVMRGNPMGSPIWVAFEVPAFVLSEEQLRAQAIADSLAAAGEVVPVNRVLDTTSDVRLQTLASLEGSCPANAETAKFRSALEKTLAKLPKEQNAWATAGASPAETFLWFRRNANYLLADKITGQDSLHNPLPRLLELKHYLDSIGVQLLVVPVPVKEEIYAERLVAGTPADLCVNPAGREFTREMLAAGLDVLDIYPALMAAKAGDEPPHFSYQRYDTHWSLPGMLAAMEQLAARVTQYSWYGDAGAKPGSLNMQETTTLREGDLVAHLPDAEKAKYPADTLPAMKIFKGAEPYKGGKNAPILLMGDSFTGVFESVDQKSGGPGSLLAYATGLDVQVLTSWGGGPGVYHRMMKMKKDMQSKRLVVYMMTARDFWQSPMEWDALR
jgi:alginate O-acetyltransferase complex protein AlgJ